MTILRNNGFARFIAPATSPEAAGVFPTAVAGADLVVSDYSSDNLTFLRNR